jgi:Glycosyl hydrolase family 67 N-terminus.
MINKKGKLYSSWLSHSNIENSKYKEYLKNISISHKSEVIESALSELKRAFEQIGSIKEAQVVYESEKDIKDTKYIKLVKKKKKMK